jgi:hypothetical protein
METRMRFINGLLQQDSEEPAGSGDKVTDLTFINGLLDHVETRPSPNKPRRAKPGLIGSTSPRPCS